jgi:hypothetical protein
MTTTDVIEADKAFAFFVATLNEASKMQKNTIGEENDRQWVMSGCKYAIRVLSKLYGHVSKVIPKDVSEILAKFH